MTKTIVGNLLAKMESAGSKNHWENFPNGESLAEKFINSRAEDNPIFKKHGMPLKEFSDLLTKEFGKAQLSIIETSAGEYTSPDGKTSFDHVEIWDYCEKYKNSSNHLVKRHSDGCSEDVYLIKFEGVKCIVWRYDEGEASTHYLITDKPF